MILTATQQDTQQIIDLWTYCFDDTPEFIDFFFKSCYKPENTLVAKDGDQVSSCLQLLPYRMFLRGKVVDVCYIVGVATWPEYRGKGLASKLLQYTDEVLQQRKIHLTILLPFQYAFYRKYGWEVCYDLLTYREVGMPQSRKRLTGEYIRIDINRDNKVLSDCYSKFMSPFNGYIIRSRADWKKTIKDVELDNGTGYLYKEGNQATGYILYTIADKELWIKELFYLTPDAKNALLQLAYHHTGQVERIMWKAPATDTTYLTMQDSRGKLEKETFVMGRIHDIVGALSGISYQGTPIVIGVSDSIYSRNNGCWLIEGRDGISAVSAVSQKPDIEMDISVLTQLLWGYLNVDIAKTEGLLTYNSEEAFNSLKTAFPPMNNFMTEEF
jgi:predicted acetyltransferase